MDTKIKRLQPQTKEERLARWKYCEELFGEGYGCAFYEEPCGCKIGNTPEHCKKSSKR